MPKSSMWRWGSEPEPKPSLLSKVPVSIPTPSLPSLASLPSLPSLSLPRNLKLPKWSKLDKAQRYIIIGAATVSTLIVLRIVAKAASRSKLETIPSPKDRALSLASVEEVKSLPYPPNALPGARDVDSPYGSIRVYEWGPEDGERVLFLHGISTPSIALTEAAYKLVAKGHRVMLFDLWGRGYSSAPSPHKYHYDSSLYISQILLCLQSSSISWTPFTLVGYSLGGALAADFTSYFPTDIKGLVLIAPGGIIRTSHITWKSKLLYQSGGWIPEWLVETMVARRLWNGPEEAKAIEPEADTATDTWETTSISSRSSGKKRRSIASSMRTRHHSSSHSSSATAAAPIPAHNGLLPDNPNSTVSAVVDWQIQHHKGFIPAFISTIRHAPIHEQHHRWEIIKDNIERKRGELRRVYLILGETDPIVIADEVAEDAEAVLGAENVKVKILKGAGHELAVDRADEVVDIIRGMLKPRKKK